MRLAEGRPHVCEDPRPVGVVRLRRRREPALVRLARGDEPGSAVEQLGREQVQEVRDNKETVRAAASCVSET